MRWMPCRGHSHHGRCWLHPKTATRLHLRCTNGCYTWRRHSTSQKERKLEKLIEALKKVIQTFLGISSFLEGKSFARWSCLASTISDRWHATLQKFWLWPPQWQLALASTFKWTNDWNDWWMCTSGTFHAHISMVHVPVEAVTRKVWPAQVGHGTATESPRTPKLTSAFLPPLHVMIWFSQSLSSWKIYGFQAIRFPVKI